MLLLVNSQARLWATFLARGNSLLTDEAGFVVAVALTLFSDIQPEEE
jgi:hypothetical protein